MLIFVLLGGAILAGCNQSDTRPPAATSSQSDEPTQAQERLPTVRLWLGPAEVNAEMALTANQVRTGLMFRTNLPEDDGMIFVFPQPMQASFWMKNCTVPLTCAYIAPDGAILELHNLEPHNTNAVVADSHDVQYVLEVNRDWFQRHGVKVGTYVRTEHGTLQETFGNRAASQ